jgi:hypothetical protein
LAEKYFSNSFWLKGGQSNITVGTDMNDDCVLMVNYIHTFSRGGYGTFHLSAFTPKISNFLPISFYCKNIQFFTFQLVLQKYPVFLLFHIKWGNVDSNW